MEDDRSNKDLLKEEKIAKEAKRLTRLFSKIDLKTKKVVSSLIQNAAFMSITLSDLQNTMNKKGLISKYQNGENQWGTKKSPEVEIYNTMIKNYSSVVKQLTDLLPKQEKFVEDDGFDKFVNDK